MKSLVDMTARARLPENVVDQKFNHNKLPVMFDASFAIERFKFKLIILEFRDMEGRLSFLKDSV